MKGFMVILVGLLSIAYLLNPGMGVFDLIPDNFPIVGNLDEATATAILLSCLAYFGVDLTKLFKRDKKRDEVAANIVDVDVEK